MSMRDYLGRKVHKTSSGSTNSSVKIISLVIVLTSLVIILCVLFLKGREGIVEVDPTTLCPTNRPPSEVIVFLLDMSNILSEPQKIKIRNELERLHVNVSRFGLIEAYAIDSNPERVINPIIHMCNPGTGENLNRIYQNPDLARKRWNGFMEELNSKLDTIMAGPESPTSPIFEAVQATALRTFNRRDMDDVPKRLVIVSDLLQNVPGKLILFDNIPSFEKFRLTSYFSQVRCDLSGVSVNLLYLVRPGTAQKWPDHKDFWEKYFIYQGAIVENLEPVFGANLQNGN